MLVLLAVPALPVAVGPPTLVLDPGEAFYFNPDASFPFFRSADGKQRIVVWGPGRPTRYVGASLDAMAQSGPCPAPARRASGIGTGWDSAGTWMLAAERAPDGMLVALTHVEDHTFADGGVGEWNSSGVWTSSDDGRSWMNLGQVCGAAKPERARYGGLDLRVMVWNRARRAWLGYCGARAFESKDPHAAPGTWYGYHDGAFSQRIDPTQTPPPLSPVAGLSESGPDAVTWGSLSWNAALGKYLYVWRAAGASPRRVLMALSADGLSWETPRTLFALPEGEAGSLDYPTLIGDSSSVTGRDALLVVARTPSTGLRRKDMVERWVHFGPLTRPGTPPEVQATGQGALDPAVTVSWDRVPLAEEYGVWREEGKGWSCVGTVRSSAARPSYVDRLAVPGRRYVYRVDARNALGTSGRSASASGSPVAGSFAIMGPSSGLVLEGLSEGVRLQRPQTGRAAQAWRFVSEDGQGYRIVNVATGLCLEERGPENSVALGASGAPWRVEPTGPTVALIVRSNGRCLDAVGDRKTPGTPLVTYPYGGAPNQAWHLVRLAHVPSEDIPGGK